MNWTSLSGAWSSPIRADRNGERGRRARSFRRLAENTRAAHERTIECRLPRIRNQSAGRRLERPRRSRSGCMTRICAQFVLLGFSHKKYLRNLDTTDSAIVVLLLDSLYVLFV